MPASSLEDALATVTEYAAAAQHTHLGEFEWPNDHHGNAVRGYAFQDPTGTSYRVYGPADHDYMTVVYEINLLTEIAGELNTEDVDRYLGTPVAYRVHEDEDDRIIAARAYLDSLDSETMDGIKQEVSERLKNQGVTFELQTTDNESLYRFLVYRKIFPYHEGFTPESLFSAVRAVSRPGQDAVEVLTDHIDLSEIGGNAVEEVAGSESDTSEDRRIGGMFK